MLTLVRAFIHDETGEDLIKHGLLGSFVAAISVATLISDPLGVRLPLVGAFQKELEALYMAAQGDLARA